MTSIVAAICLGCVTRLMAATAVLECTREASAGAPAGRSRELDRARGGLLEFRFAVVSGWQPAQGSLLLHMAPGSRVPSQLRIGLMPADWSEKRAIPKPGVKMARIKIAAEKEGWIKAELPPDLLAPLLRGTAHGFVLRGPLRVHSRETVEVAPHLIVEGEPRVQ